MVPPDIDAIVLDIMETCTVPDFALFLKTLSTNASLNGMTLTYTELLERTENRFRTLVITKKWDAVGHQGSSIQAQRLHPAPGRANNNPRPRISMPGWSRTPPAENEPHERTFETTLFKWCATCQRWFFGHRAHLTNEHTPGHPSCVIICASPMPSIVSEQYSSFNFHLRLGSDYALPVALNAHITCADFDPDFVATLLSRQPCHDIVDVILDTGCTFSITPDRRDFCLLR